MEPIKVIMYSKNICPLCDKAKRVLEEIQEEIAIDLEEIDIYQDDALLEKYQLMIPVIEIDGEEIAYGLIQKEPIRKRLLEKIR
jgi:glutaredoxin